jgi:hypothetical protein
MKTDNQIDNTNRFTTVILDASETQNSALKTENPAPKRDGRPLTRLEGVSDRQLERINAWLKKAVPYRKIVELCRTEFEKTIPHMTFVRYSNRTEILRQCEALADSKEAALEISRAAVTGDASFSTNTLELLEQVAFDLAAAYQRDADADDLRTLKDLWPLIHKAKATAIRQRHAAVQETKCQLRAQELALKEKLASHRIQMDLARQNQNPNPNLLPKTTQHPALSSQHFDRPTSTSPDAIHQPASGPTPGKPSNPVDPLPNPAPQIFGPCPLPPEVMAENQRHAELLLAGKIKTHYKRDPQNSLLAKICYWPFDPPSTDTLSAPTESSPAADRTPDLNTPNSAQHHVDPMQD